MKTICVTNMHAKIMFYIYQYLVIYFLYEFQEVSVSNKPIYLTTIILEKPIVVKGTSDSII